MQARDGTSAKSVPAMGVYVKAEAEPLGSGALILTATARLALESMRTRDRRLDPVAHMGTPGRVSF